MIRFGWCFAGAGAVLVCALPAYSVSTAFTYQGQIQRDDVPLDTPCDLQFTLFNAPSGGTQVGATLTSSNVAVSNGVFTTQLDFGAASFTGPDRWLELATRCPAGSGSFVTLLPRQAITATPYALFANTLANDSVTASQLADGAVTSAKIADGSIGSADLASAAVNAQKIAPGGDGQVLTTSGGAVAWQAPGGANGWGLTGNSGTDPNTTFLGTTDNEPVILRANNQRVLRLYDSVADPDLHSPVVIAGHSDNQVADGVVGATIAGGGGAENQRHRVDGHFATVGGGVHNRAYAVGSTVAGGELNDATGQYGTIGGGRRNNVLNDYGTVSGGTANTVGVGADHSTIGGGASNSVISRYGTVGGGEWNGIDGNWNTIAGGRHNSTEGQDATVGGGAYNAAKVLASTVGGGSENLADGWNSTIGGGQHNLAHGKWAAVLGGGGDNDTMGNRAEAQWAIVGGGNKNHATGDTSSILGGTANSASGAGSTIGGGISNKTGPNATGAVVPGGERNEANGAYSFAAGRVSRANADGCFAWSDSTDASFTCSVVNRFMARASGGVIFYTTPNTTTGVQLAAGGGSWSSVSDRNVKRDVAAVDPRAVLDKVVATPVHTWSYAGQDPAIRHIGPMAQDFHAAFGVGEDDTHIATIDADGVALAAIQGLHQLVRERDARITALEARLAALEARGTAGQ